MNEGLERIQTEEASLNSDSDFAVLRKLNRDKEDPEEALRARGYLRAVEDAVEQNDNSFDGIINNLPDEAQGSVSGMQDDRKSLVDQIRKEHEMNTQPVPAKPVQKIYYTDGEERVL
jgi:hypothetical protein